MLDKTTLQFLRDLKKNNNREWFKENKHRYDVARTDFEYALAGLIPLLGKFDKSVQWLEPKNCIFRIYRDTRFSKDKTPYKSNLGAHILANGRAQERHSAGYYLHIEPGNCFLASGAHTPPSAWLNAIRENIHEHGSDLKRILKRKKFKEYFGELAGEKLKTAPRNYAKTHPDIELLRHKSFLIIHEISDDQLMSENFLGYATKVFKAAYPFKEFLNR